MREAEDPAFRQGHFSETEHPCKKISGDGASEVGGVTDPWFDAKDDGDDREADEAPCQEFCAEAQRNNKKDEGKNFLFAVNGCEGNQDGKDGPGGTDETDLRWAGNHLSYAASDGTEEIEDKKFYFADLFIHDAACKKEADHVEGQVQEISMEEGMG